MASKGKIAPDMDDFFGTVEEAPVQPRRRKTAPRIFDQDNDDIFNLPDDGARKGAASHPSRPSVRPDDKGPSRPPKPKRPERRPDPDRPNPLVAFFKDYRLHISVGIILCFVAIIAAAMCVSFLSENGTDQSSTLNSTVREMANRQPPVNNWGNSLGAKIGELLMVRTLGIGSFAVALYVFLLGLACMHVLRIPFWSLSFRCLFTAAAASVIIGFFTMNQALTFPPGGDHGLYINRLLEKYSGALGAFGVTVLLTALLVTVYLHPLRRLCTAIGSMLPKPKPHDDDYDKQVAADATTEALAALDSAESEQQPEAAPAPAGAAPEAAAPSPAEGAADLDGFVIDDSPAEEAAEAAQPAAAEEPAAEHVAAAEIAAAPGEPAMIIKVANPERDESAENAPAAIRNGDHIGLDEVYDPRASHSNYRFPTVDLLMERESGAVVDPEEQAANKQQIVRALRSFNIEIVRIEATIGPTVTLYEIVPAEGIRISKIRSLEDDIALNIAAEGIRIIAPLPGRGTIGIEVPNKTKRIVGMRRVIDSSAFRAKSQKMHLPLALGSTISDDVFVTDLAKMPHLLVAGATGQGKSVGLNCIITSLIYAKHPDELKLVLVDPKMVEFSIYGMISKAFMAKLPGEDNAIITDAQKALATLNSLCVEMDARYELFSNAMVRDIETYNDKFTARRLNPENGHRYMPYIVTIVDEFADLITSAGKEIFVPIARLAAKGRASGIHVIIATQRPSTDVITGMIKANFPARMAFRVLSSIDSKTILDRPGAHRLIGRGDMLTLINGMVERVQCAFVDTPEIERICEHIGSQDGFVACYELPEPPSDGEPAPEVSAADFKNEEFVQCCKFISTQTNASITILQRKFSIGFNKAGRYIDQMEALGIVGPANGSKPRQVLMTIESVEQMFGV